MRMSRVSVVGSWFFLILAMGTLIVLPGCRAVQGAGQDIEAVGRGGERVVEQEQWD